MKVKEINGGWLFSAETKEETENTKELVKQFCNILTDNYVSYKVVYNRTFEGCNWEVKANVIDCERIFYKGVIYMLTK